MNVFLFDMDNSLADHDGALLHDLDKLASHGEPPVDLLEASKIPHLRNRINLIRSQVGWWANLGPIGMGLQLYRLAKKMGFTCEILTKGPQWNSQVWKEKVDWCQKYVSSDVNVHIVSDNENDPEDKASGKGRVYGKVLYDDYPPYVLKWLESRPRGLGIMRETPHNKDFAHPNVLKIADMGSANAILVEQALRCVLSRRPGEPLELAGWAAYEKDLAVRVGKGIALLDKKLFQWREKINLDALDMYGNCVLKQLFGDYKDGLNAIGLVNSVGGWNSETTAALGFSNSPGHNVLAFDRLTEEWKRQILETP